MDWSSLIDFYLFFLPICLEAVVLYNLFVVVWVERCNNWYDSISVYEAEFLSFIQKTYMAYALINNAKGTMCPLDLMQI